MSKENVEESVKQKIGVFDFMNDITYNKEYLFNDDTESVFNGYIINMGLMQHLDTILLANETNKMGSISKEMHHDFLFYSIEKAKRYGKWAKQDKTDEEIISLLKEEYHVSNEVAKEYLKLMDDETRKKMITLSKTKGGRK